MHLGSSFYTDDELAACGFRSLGANVKIKRTAALYFTENISVGSHTRIDDFTVIVASREPVTLANHVHIASHCYISGSDGFEMADYCGLAPGVAIFSSSDDYSGAKLTNPTLPRHMIGGTRGAVALEKHVIIGANTVVLPGVTIGLGSAVGAQSLVNKSLDAWGVYCGVPVRRLRDRSRELLDLERVLTAEDPTP